MRFSLLTLAALLGAGLLGSRALAIANTDYQQLRANTPPVVLQAKDLHTQLPLYAGRSVELAGTVNGVFVDGERTGFLLNLDPEQTVIVLSPRNDADIAVGAQLRVLARVPANNSMLEAIAVTRTNPAPHVAAYTTALQPSAIPEINPALQPVMVTAAPETPEAPETVQALAGNPEVIRLYAQRILTYNPRVDDGIATKIASVILQKGEQYGVDPRLVLALVRQESAFNHRAVSHAGARGLGQLMPATARSLGVRDSFDIEDNLDGAVRYLAEQLDTFNRRASLALAAYNAGPGAVRRYGGIPPYRETQNYVRVIWKNYCELAGLDPATGQQIAAR